jgi:hypothetical protein
LTNQVKGIEQTAVFNAWVQKVRNAVSTSDRISAWFMPNELRDWLSYYERFWTNKLSMLKHLVEDGI